MVPQLSELDNDTSFSESMLNLYKFSKTSCVCHSLIVSPSANQYKFYVKKTRAFLYSIIDSNFVLLKSAI